ncbi:APC family permease [Salinisphaera hydrothermalis]|uniref:APC family permease n=1 Tax=Salinisphaera hydrothermalis TaxID=563188 RepID=UPI00333FBA07
MASSQSGGSLKRHAGPIGLLFASTTSMIGSGWLFGAYHAAKLAGPWSILSWVIGAVIIMMLAFCFAELATMFPRSGALVHISHASHGDGLGRIWSWMLFLAYVAVPAVEAEAVVTYANNYLPFLVNPSSGVLTVVGFFVSVVLLGIFALLNLLAIRKLLQLNSAITWWKIFVPLATVVGLIVVAWHPENMHAAPGTYKMSGIFTALPAAGIVFSFLGFRTAIELAGESSNPHRNMPFAVIGSVVLASVVYVGLQIAFIMALAPSQLSGGWSTLSFAGDLGPFAGLAAGLGMTWLAAILYIDAYVSPGGTGLIYLTGGSRILMANGQLDTGPKGLAKLSSQGVPWMGVLVMWIVGCLFLLPFPAWQKMVEYITSITVLTYGIGPVVLLCLRRNAPNAERPFKLAGANVLAPITFILSNWIIYWAGFYTNTVLFILIGVGFVIYALYYHWVARMPAEEFGWRYISWLLPWFGGMWVLSALGGIGGGLGVLPFVPELVLSAIWSMVVLWIAYKTTLSPAETERAIEKILKEDDAGENAPSLP